MAMQTGTVTIDDDGTEHTTPGLGTNLYQRRKLTQNLPDPDHKKGCVTTADAGPGSTTLQLSDTSGYKVGDALGNVTYLDGTVSATWIPKVTAINSPTQFTISPAVPSATPIPPIPGNPPNPPNLTLPAGTKFGFQGTDQEWRDQALPQLVKTLRAIASEVIGDADEIINYLKGHMDLKIRTTDVHLQVAGGVDTDGPAADRTIPSPGAVE